MRAFLVLTAALAAAWFAVAPSVGGEEEEAGAEAAPAVSVTARLVRLDGPAGLALAAGEVRVAGEHADELLRRLRGVSGPEAIATWTVGGEAAAAPLRLSLLERVPYLADYEVERGLGEPPIRAPVLETISEGAVADLRSRLDPDGPALELGIRARLASLVRPIATFDASISSGPPLIIQLPELAVSRRDATVRVPVGSRGFVGLDDRTLLAVDVTAKPPRDAFVPPVDRRR